MAHVNFWLKENVLFSKSKVCMCKIITQHDHDQAAIVVNLYSASVCCIL